MCQPAVGESLALQHAHGQCIKFFKLARLEIHFEIDNFLDLRQEPEVDFCQLMDFLKGESIFKSVTDIPNTLRPRLAEFLLDNLAISSFLVKAVGTNLESAQGLLE